MTRTEQQFFELLRSALWGTSVDEAWFTSDVHWGEILSLADRQAVLGLIGEAVATLPDKLQPDRQKRYRLHLYRVRTAQMHERLNTVLAEVLQRLAEAGIPAVLLKGQGVAQNYLCPELRACGDIDLYVGPAHYRQACRLMESWYEAGADDRESEKHYHFTRRGVEIEIHRYVQVQYNPWINRRFQHWTAEQLGSSGCGLRIWHQKGVDVCLPPVQFDALYILDHLSHHYVSSGVGLRQLCDWVRFLHVHHAELDRTRLQDDLRRLHLMRYWQVFGVLAVDLLGLSSEAFPFYSPRFRTVALQSLDFILQVGNFGRFSEYGRTRRPRPYVVRKIHAFRCRMKMAMTSFRLFPREVTEYILWYLYDGMKRFVQHK